uniref:Uncharacterized protein n=1 Tax=Cacopsylla melanoneura TaxID=428564 RepID=A0A8D9AW71_9HEMI
MGGGGGDELRHKDWRIFEWIVEIKVGQFFEHGPVEIFNWHPSSFGNSGNVVPIDPSAVERHVATSLFEGKVPFLAERKIILVEFDGGLDVVFVLVIQTFFGFYSLLNEFIKLLIIVGWFSPVDTLVVPHIMWIIFCFQFLEVCLQVALIKVVVEFLVCLRLVIRPNSHVREREVLHLVWDQTH